MPELFFDHETYLIDRCALAPRVVCTSWTFDDQEEIPVALWRDTPAREWLETPGLIFDGANTAYDTAVQMAADPELIPLWIDAYCTGRVRDVQLDAKLMDIASGDMHEGRSFSLAALALRLCDTVMEKDAWRTRYAALDGVPVAYWPEGAIAYSRDDSRATRAVRRALQASELPWAQAGITVLGQHAYAAAAADHVLHLASCWGVCTDPKRTAALAERVQAHLDDIRGELVQAGLIVNGKVNALAGHRRMVEVMTAQGRRRSIQLSDKWQDLYDLRTSRGEDPATVHEQILCHSEKGRGTSKLDRDQAILSGDELLVRRADYTSSKLLLGRVERMRAGHVFPLQTRFDSVKETFRTSSTQPQEPLIGEQMQNFPRGKKEDAYGLRECFCPRAVSIGPWGEDEGVFIGGDFAQAELCCLSELMFKFFGYTRMGELLNAGVDLHWHFAAASLGLSIEQVKELGTEHRDRAKPANFGFPGGMGVDNFVLYSRKSYGVTFRREEVKPLKDRWMSTFPEVREYLQWVSDKGAGWTSVHAITGFVRGDLGYTNGSNHGFQHLAAYAAKVALIEVNRACFSPESPLFGWRIWNYVHDEILLEGPKSRASAAAAELARIMEECFNRFTRNFPTHVDAFVTKTWSKKCKTVRGPNGEYLEWQMKEAA